jgi:hypothetical protein
MPPAHLRPVPSRPNGPVEPAAAARHVASTCPTSQNDRPARWRWWRSPGTRAAVSQAAILAAQI